MAIDLTTELRSAKAQLAAMQDAREAPAKVVSAAEDELLAVTVALGEKKALLNKAEAELADAKAEQAAIAAKVQAIDPADDAALHAHVRGSDVVRVKVEALTHRVGVAKAPLPALEKAQVDARQKLRRAQVDALDIGRRRKESALADRIEQVQAEIWEAVASIQHDLDEANQLEHAYDQARGAAYTATDRGSIWRKVQPGNFWDGIATAQQHHGSLERGWDEAAERARVAAARRDWEDARPVGGYQATGREGAAEYASGMTPAGEN
jgi:chromosome segregation ATPase